MAFKFEVLGVEREGDGWRAHWSTPQGRRQSVLWPRCPSYEQARARLDRLVARYNSDTGAKRYRQTATIIYRGRFDGGSPGTDVS